MRPRPLLAVFLTVVIDLLGFGLVLPLLPLYAEKHQASGLVIGLLFASFSGMQFLASPIWGRLSDRIGRRPVILVGLFGSFASYVLFGVAEFFPDPLVVLFVSRVTAGIFGGTISTAYAYIADVTSHAERGRGMALIGAAFGIGFTLGPIVGGLGWMLSPMAPGFLAAAFSAGAMLYAWRRLPEPERHAPPAGQGRLAALQQALEVPGVLRILLLTFFGHACFAMFESTLALTAKFSFDFGPVSNGWLFSYVGLWSVLAQGFVVRRYLPRVGERRFTIWGTIAIGVGLIAVGQASSVGMLLAVGPIAVLGFAMLTPSISSLLSTRIDASSQGGAFGLNQSAASLARIVGPVLGNVLLDLGRRHGMGVSLPHWVGAGIMGLGLLLALGLRASPATSAPSPQGGVGA